MNVLQRTGLWFKLLRKSTVAAFRTDSQSGEWLQRNGYRLLAREYGSFSEQRALASTAIYGGTKIIAEDVGSLPLKIYERKDKSSFEALDHPLYELLHDQPNPETTAMEFREALTANAILCGDGYARIIRDGKRPTALWQLMPYNVRTDRNALGATFYRVSENGTEKQYPAEDIMHLRGFSRDGKHGESILEIARSTIGLTLDQNEYAAKFFKNDHTPGIALETADKLGPEGVANAKAAWKKVVESHDVAVLQEGMKVNVIGQTNVESQLIEQRTFQILEVCRILRLPPHKLMELSRATFSNIEQQNIQYYTETLRPWLVRWEQTIRRCLIPAEERGKIFAEHSIEGLLRGDFKAQSEGFARLLEKGVLSINQVREYLNLNPVEGGDEHFIQLNMQTIAQAAEEEEAEPQPVPVATKLLRVKGML